MQYMEWPPSSAVCFIAASTSCATTEHVTCALCASFVCPESQPPTCHSPDLSNEASKERGREGEAGCVRLWVSVWQLSTFKYDKGTWYTVQVWIIWPSCQANNLLYLMFAHHWAAHWDSPPMGRTSGGGRESNFFIQTFSTSCCGRCI